jgi:anti-sigma factor RsiW
MKCAEPLNLLDVYMDGELDLERIVELERHLEVCPGCPAELASRRALSSAMRDKLDYHTAPLALQRAVRKALARAKDASSEGSPLMRRTRPAWMRLAASFVLVAGLSSSLTYYVTPTSSDPIPDEIFASHVRSMQSDDRLIDVASSDEHTVKPWLDAKLDFAPPVKDLSSDGFSLVGGRVDYIGGRAVAALVYHYRKHVITLFIWPDNGDTKPVAATVRRGDRLAQWSDGAMTYWAISDIGAPEFTEFCTRLEAAEAVPEGPASNTSQPQFSRHGAGKVD